MTAPTVTRCPHAGCGWQAHSQHDGPRETPPLPPVPSRRLP
jgi:hypothetical protein